MQEAKEAFASSPADYIRQAEVPQASRQVAAPCLSPDLKSQALAVNAACSGNPGKMEYRGVHLPNFQQTFPFGPQYFGVNTSVILKKLFIFQRIL